MKTRATYVTTTDPSPGGLEEISRARFVGREAELAALLRVFDTSPTIVLVEGEAGVGKSRLVREALAARQHSAPRVVEATCPPYRQPLSLGPIVDGFRTSTAGVAGLALSPLAGALRPLFPEWAADLPPAPEPLGDATGARHRLFRALGELATALEVAVLVVEDVHWADETTLEFLLFLASSRQYDGLTLVTTYRPEDVPPDSLVLRLSSRRHGDIRPLRLPVTGLNRAEIGTLVSSMLDGKAVSDEFAGFLHERTEGVPFAVEELVRLMYARADLTRRDGSWVRRHLDEIDVPPSVRDAVLERLVRLDGDVQDVLKAAAVVSDPADEATLSAVAGLSEQVMGQALGVALAAGWLRTDERAHLQFAHALSSRAVYDAVAVPQRRAMHQRAARVLEGHRPTPLVRLARHFREAGETAKWCEYAEQAADQAVELGDRMTATALLNSLVRAPDLPPSATARLARKLAGAALLRHEDVDQLHAQVVETLRSILDSGHLTPKEAAAVRGLRGRLLAQMGEYEAADREMELALPELDLEPAEAARAMTLLGCARGDPKPVGHYLAWMRQAAEVTRLVTETHLRISLVADRAAGLLLLGESTGWEVAAELPEHSDDLEESRRITAARGNLGYCAVLWGRYAEADRLLSLALAQVASADHRTLVHLRCNKAKLDWCMGRWDQLTHVRLWAADQDPQVRTEFEWHLLDGLLDAATGSTGRAVEKLQLVVDGARRSTFAELPMTAAAAIARLRLDEGDVDAALRVTDRSMEMLVRSGIWIWATDLSRARVEALVRSERFEEGVELVAAFERGLAGRAAPAPGAALSTCRALLAEHTGAAEEAAVEFERAADAWDALPRPYDASLDRARAAALLLRIGRVSAGLDRLSNAYQALRQLGARRDADRVAHALREHGVEVSRPWRGGRRGYGDALSPRESEVVRLVVDGLSNREIGGRLFLSPKTVSRHLNSAMRKLRVGSRAALGRRVAEDPARPDAVSRDQGASEPDGSALRRLPTE